MCIDLILTPLYCEFTNVFYKFVKTILYIGRGGVIEENGANVRIYVIIMCIDLILTPLYCEFTNVFYKFVKTLLYIGRGGVMWRNISLTL